MTPNTNALNKHAFARARYNVTWRTLYRWIDGNIKCIHEINELEWDIDNNSKKLPPAIQNIIIKYFG
jgi:predicted secreted Zn-dependent protease